MYYNGRKVRIVDGHWKGRNAVIEGRLRQKNRVQYKVHVVGHPFQAVVRSSYIRAGWYKKK